MAQVVAKITRNNDRTKKKLSFFFLHYSSTYYILPVLLQVFRKAISLFVFLFLVSDRIPS